MALALTIAAFLSPSVVDGLPGGSRSPSPEARHQSGRLDQLVPRGERQERDQPAERHEVLPGPHVLADAGVQVKEPEDLGHAGAC